MFSIRKALEDRTVMMTWSPEYLSSFFTWAMVMVLMAVPLTATTTSP